MKNCVIISSKANFEPFKISKGISPLKLSPFGRSLILFCTLVSEASLKLNSINEFLLGSLKSLFFFGKHNFRILIHVSVGKVQFASILKRFRVFHKIEIIQVLCSWITVLRCFTIFFLRLFWWWFLWIPWRFLEYKCAILLQNWSPFLPNLHYS